MQAVTMGGYVLEM
jgi:hypothetical protein